MAPAYGKNRSKRRRLAAAIGLALLLPLAQAQESMTFRKIQETGIVTVGFRDGSIPFSYLDKKQRPIGYSMDICARIVEAVKLKLKLPNLEVKFRPVTSANRIPFVVNDIIDLECGTTTNTGERQKKVAFSVTTFVAVSALAAKPAARIRSVDDLSGKAVVSTAGTTYVSALVDINRSRELNMQIMTGTDHAESFLIMETDRAAAFAMDDVLLYGLVANAKNPAEYLVVNSGLSTEPYGVVLRKDDPEFKKLADETIIGLFSSGEIEGIYQKWFQSPIPPNGVNLRLPMSAALRKAIAQPTDSSDPASYR